MKTRSTIILTILVVLVSFGLTVQKFSVSKKQIDQNKVSSISILKVTGPPDTIKCTWKFLTEEQIKQFTAKWNKSPLNDLRKYIPVFKLSVRFKNDSIRNFRTNGQYIKENIDWCSDFKDKDYFEKLYSEATLKGNR